MRNKFSAVDEVYDNYKFASGVERQRYQDLRLRERAGEIYGLVIHPEFILQPAFTHWGKKIQPITFTADFKYIERGDPDIPGDPEKIVIEDVKGGKATITEAFGIRWKLAKRLNPTLHFRIVKY